MNKQKILIGLALLLFVCVVVWAVRTVPQAPPPQSIETESKTMTMDADTRDVTMENLTGKFYDEEGRVVTLTAKQGHYDAKSKDITIEEDVDVKTSDGAALSCDKLLWSADESKLTADGHAYIKHEDMEATADKIESTNAFHHFKAIGHAHIVKGVKDAGAEGAGAK